MQTPKKSVRKNFVRKTLQDVTKEKLKLHVFQHGAERYHLLISKDNKTLFGYIGTGHYATLPEYDQYESVWYSAALQGYGPLMYDIAMSEATKHNKWLCSDSTDGSDSSKNVWNYYLQHRSEELIIQELFLRTILSRPKDLGIKNAYKLKIPLDASVILCEPNMDKKILTRKADTFFSREFHRRNS